MDGNDSLLSELRELKRQLSVAICLIECQQIVNMSGSERQAHAARFGKEAFVIGDFVITRRAGAKTATTGQNLTV